MMKRLKFFALAALLVMPLTACDEGDDDLVAPSVSGTVTGTVTIDGDGASGITVTLSSGATATTDASGRYTFNNVSAGAYTVSISGVPSGVTFDALAKAAVVATNGQVVTVDFSGSSIRTSSISGQVSSGGAALSGVTVTLSGAATGTATTDANGNYSFGGLPAGSYTVAISGLPDGVNCAETSKTTTVETGMGKVVSFACNPSGAGTISGVLYIDENSNDVMDNGETAMAAGNVTISLEGPNIGEVRTTVTNADGSYAFTDLVSGSYNICIDETDTDIPDEFAYGGSECYTRTISGGTTTVNFPFDITGQIVDVFAFLGTDDDEPGIRPVEGVEIALYPTFDAASAGNNELGVEETDSLGRARFEFDREDDIAPGAGTDQIVFAKFLNSPAFTALNGDTVIEIRYISAVDMAPDTFDLLNTRVMLGFRAMGGDADDPNPLEGWNAALFRNDTTTAIQSAVTGEDGYVWFTETSNASNLPDTFYMRLSGLQPQAGGHQFSQHPDPEEDFAFERGRFLAYVHDGTAPVNDSLDIGNQVVVFETADLFGRVYHEQDDTAWFTAGDDAQNSDNIRVVLLQNGVAVDTVTPVAGDGGFTFTNLETDTDDVFTVRAYSAVDDQEIVSPTEFTVGNEFGGSLDGSTNAVLFCPLGADTVGTAASCASFAHKYNNGGVIATVQTADNTPVENATVRIQSLPRLIGEGGELTEQTDASGEAEFTELLEGPYVVSVLDSIDADGDTVWTVVAPNNRADTVDIQGNADIDLPTFIVTRHDTQILGVVVNDRDADLTVVDPGEALEGVQLTLTRNDTLIATTTTNAAGEYTFDNLLEGTYEVTAENTANATVLRGFDSDGDPIQSLTAQTSGNPLVRGSHDPNPLPRWDYNNSTALNVQPTHFTFLYSNTEARGEVVDGSGDPVANVSVTLRRCDDSVAPTSPPTAGSCADGADADTDAYFPGFTALTTTTNSSGDFSFTGLQEGVYEVDAAGGSTPNTYLYLLVGSGDIETATFTTP